MKKAPALLASATAEALLAGAESHVGLCCPEVERVSDT
jgi:hypothetical protein